MKPVKFKEQNIKYTKPEGMADKECGSLPACRHEKGIVICWRMSLKERLKVLVTGRLWIDISCSFQPPIWIGTDKPFKKERRRQ